MRTAKIERKTKETDIVLELNLDGTGKTEISTGIGFFDHMLNSFARHGFFDLKVSCKGDLEVDCHHTIEDVGIVLVRRLTRLLAVKKALPDTAAAFSLWMKHCVFVLLIYPADNTLTLI